MSKCTSYENLTLQISLGPKPVNHDMWVNLTWVKYFKSLYKLSKLQQYQEAWNLHLTKILTLQN